MVDAKAVAFYAAYQPTVEDLAAIQEYYDECRAVAAKQARARDVEATDTVSQRTPPVQPKPLQWDAPSSPLCAAFEVLS